VYRCTYGLPLYRRPYTVQPGHWLIDGPDEPIPGSDLFASCQSIPEVVNRPAADDEHRTLFVDSERRGGGPRSESRPPIRSWRA
jgi:hypothetical protein